MSLWTKNRILQNQPLRNFGSAVTRSNLLSDLVMPGSAGMSVYLEDINERVKGTKYEYSQLKEAIEYKQNKAKKEPKNISQKKIPNKRYPH